MRTFYTLLCILSLTAIQCSSEKNPALLEVKKGDHVVLIGNNLCSRMMNYGHFETELYLRFPDSQLVIRNMCDGGNTPGFRPHSARISPWAFPGAEAFQDELANESGSKGHFETPDEWLTRLQADVILAFFGYNESFGGHRKLDNFKAELEAFIQHTQSQTYNGKAAPQLVLVSPIAFQNLSATHDLPDGLIENANLGQYAQAMKEVAARHQVPFLDVFSPSQKWFETKEPLTLDGFQLTDAGYAKFAGFLADNIFGNKPKSVSADRKAVKEAVLEKNWCWHHDFKMPNGVHTFGRRYEPFGPDNYPAEIAKIREMTEIRDQAIWAILKGEKMDIPAADKQTTPLADIVTNYTTDPQDYLYGQDALDALKVPPGYKIELFASEKEFPALANPVQMSFDNKGRLWVAVMPTYPHYRPGDPKPNDKLLILEDHDNDGKADHQTIFAEGLHLPIGFEFAPEGVYVSQGTNLVLLSDTDGDDKADTQEILLSGFDDHDTHHAISAFCADPSGAIYMGEGVFLHTNVETPYGPVRGTNGGFFPLCATAPSPGAHRSASHPQPMGHCL